MGMTKSGSCLTIGCASNKPGGTEQSSLKVLKFSYISFTCSSSLLTVREPKTMCVVRDSTETGLLGYIIVRTNLEQKIPAIEGRARLITVNDRSSK